MDLTTCEAIVHYICSGMHPRMALSLAMMIAMALLCAGQDSSDSSAKPRLEDSSAMLDERLTGDNRQEKEPPGRSEDSEGPSSEPLAAESSSDNRPQGKRKTNKWQATPFPVKRGLSASPFEPKGPDGERDQTAPCWDSKALNLQSSWYFNWGPIPMNCKRPFAKEFAPMIWTCWGGNCTKLLPADFREQWKAAGVKFLQGYNEPSLPRQGSLTPREGAEYWQQIDDLAQSFSPPLRLVGPAMVGWSSRGGSDWLDEFFGHLSPDMRDRIEFIAQHDYGGSARRIKRNADACYKQYGKKVWLTEFAVGKRALKGKKEIASRADQNNFMRKALDVLDSADSIYRYAWYSTRNGNYRPMYNSDGTWKSDIAYVTESSLLPKRNKKKNRWDWKMWPTSTGSIYAPKQKRWDSS